MVGGSVLTQNDILALHDYSATNESAGMGSYVVSLNIWLFFFLGTHVSNCHAAYAFGIRLVFEYFACAFEHLWNLAFICALAIWGIWFVSKSTFGMVHLEKIEYLCIWHLHHTPKSCNKMHAKTCSICCHSFFLGVVLLGNLSFVCVRAHKSNANAKWHLLAIPKAGRWMTFHFAMKLAIDIVGDC